MARHMGREALRKSSPSKKRKRDAYFCKRRQKTREKGYLKGLKGKLKKQWFRAIFMGDIVFIRENGNAQALQG